MSQKNQKDNLDENITLGGLSILLLIISAIIILFSFFAPSIFVRETPIGLDFTNTGEIGDTIGGVMSPFIAISGVLLTFLAFYIQYKANRLQQQLFRIELNEQKEQFRKTQFENQFYEMVRLHKENVNEFEINLVKTINNSDGKSVLIEEKIKGRKVLDYLTKELELCYYVAKRNFPEEDFRVLINEAYGVFYHGINSKVLTQHRFYEELYQIRGLHEKHNYSSLREIMHEKYGENWESDLYYPLFKGYSSQLAHYYRHLFQTVKFVTTRDEKLLSYEEKRKYLRILRAQLSNQEQVMLFYNWLSTFGKQWENESNKFFTDYRMIHNIYQDLMISDIDLEKIFSRYDDYKKEENRETDPLFEYQSWYI